MRNWIKIILASLFVLLILIGSYIYLNIKDRHPGYSVDLDIRNDSPGRLKIGFAAVKITPSVEDRWTDVNQDAQFDEEDGDTYEDLNQNGKFDPFWIAGFDNKRAANGIHDDLWARTMVVDDGTSRIALTSIDAIGFMHDDILDVRNLVSDETEITYSVISSTHTHEAPDLLGLWGDSYFKTGVNEEYMKFVKSQTAKSIEEATAKLEDAFIKLAINPKDAIVAVNDTREPHVFDEGIRIMQVFSVRDSSTLGTLVAWADHPETLWSDNLLISSDFPHYLREGVEKGVYHGDSLVKKGLGGVAVYFNGAIGGLMTTNPGHEIRDVLTNKVIKEPGYEKTKAQGDFLAMLVLNALDSSSQFLDQAAINIRAKTIHLDFQNPLYRLGAFMGVLDRGMSSWMKIRSEVAAFSIGPAHFITVPGEIYPEIVNGGVEKPEGQDFNIDPVEVPPLRGFMKGEYNFIFGMANDMIGYIIPKSQWDTETPFTYHRHDAPYGEVNSLGPETGPTIYREVLEVLEGLYE